MTRCSTLRRVWTLWRLPHEIEERFEARWEHWVDAAADWAPTFKQVADLEGTDVAAALTTLGLVGPRITLPWRDSARPPRGVPFRSRRRLLGRMRELTLLALAFSLGRPAGLAVPYARAAA